MTEATWKIPAPWQPSKNNSQKNAISDKGLSASNVLPSTYSPSLSTNKKINLKKALTHTYIIIHWACPHSRGRISNRIKIYTQLLNKYIIHINCFQLALKANRYLRCMYFPLLPAPLPPPPLFSPFLLLPFSRYSMSQKCTRQATHFAAAASFLISQFLFDALGM